MLDKSTHYRAARYPAVVLLTLSGCLFFSVVGCNHSDESMSGGVVGTGLSEESKGRTAESEQEQDLLEVALTAMARRDIATAELAIRKHLLSSPNDARALEIAGDLALRRNDLSTSVELYQAAFNGTETPTTGLLDKLTKLLVKSGRPFDALSALQRFIELFPNAPSPRYDLVGLATMVGLADAAVPSLQWLSQHGRGDPETLLVLADTQRVEPDGEMCEKMLDVSGSDLRPQFCLAKLDAIGQDWDSVKGRLEPVIERHPDFVPALALYGRALVELGEFESVADWSIGLPPSIEKSAEYWQVVGAWAQQRGQNEQAANAYLRIQVLDPIGHSESLSGLYRSLLVLGLTEDANQVATQITKRGVLHDALKTHLERGSRSQKAAMHVADAMIALGRVWEAEAWARLAVGLPEQPMPDIRTQYLAIRSQLTTSTPWLLPEMNLGEQIKLEKPIEFTWDLADGQQSPINEGDTALLADHSLFFEDQARQRGLIHTCEISPTAEKEGHWIYQSVCGGAGVIDFDQDGFPDLAAAMLDGQPLQSDSSPNRLFRNLGEGFVEVGDAAGYRDSGFSQGITVGDINEDGFPDIFDSNIGQNRLYINNGDGTFRDATVQAGLRDNQWTTSAVIADLDNDGLADLFATNYCGGKSPYETPCRNEDGYSTCPPLKFEAAADNVWKNAGDGTLVDLTKDWMEQSSPGRGLGLIAGNLDERPGLDVLVANDMTVNHLWSPGRTDSVFKLSDFGAICGVGFSGQSHSQASMGIAVGDADGDGDIDFFMTHFADDHNTYYEQVAPGLWADRTFQVGLGDPSMKLLGFGTQWIDFDNDGLLDLFVTNGHVDNVHRKDVSYAMPPQIFQRQPDQKWEEHDRTGLGNYFQKDHLGRALVAVDVDCDGKNDVAVTHLYEPMSLLVNRTPNAGKSIGLVLKCTSSERDAIGSTVKGVVGNRKTTVHLTAGDGYMCSSERKLLIGLGGYRQISGVEVTWPSGATEKFGILEAGQDYLLVEGSNNAFPLKSHH